MGKKTEFKHDPKTAALIRLIKSFSERVGITPTRVCNRATGDSQLYKRMTQLGHSCTLRRAYQVERYIARQRRDLPKCKACEGQKSHNQYAVPHRDSAGHEHVEEA